MASKTSEEHKKKSPIKVRVAVITISDSKHAFHWAGSKGVETEDVSGKSLVTRFQKEGHEVVFYTVVPDHAGTILETVDQISSDFAPDAIITTGGTGLGPRDVTIEALEPVFDKTLPGFGELFRYESLKEIGYATMLTRATAGLYNGIVIFCLPGSPSACETGLKLILKEIGHAVKHSKEKKI